MNELFESLMTTKKHFAAALASALLCMAGTNAQTIEI